MAGCLNEKSFIISYYINRSKDESILSRGTKIVDKCIILEDDLVPCESFFSFCKEMLDKYENDERIDRICGTNLLGQYDIPYDYFFLHFGNSIGWATWRRVAEKWEEDYNFLDDDYALSRMNVGRVYASEGSDWWVESCRQHRQEGIPYWERIIGAEIVLQHRLCIYPSKNMINHIGLDVNSTHAIDSINKLSKNAKSYFHMKVYDIEFPLKHPKYVIDDIIFAELWKKKVYGTFMSRFINKLERLFKKLKLRGE